MPVDRSYIQLSYSKESKMLCSFRHLDHEQRQTMPVDCALFLSTSLFTSPPTMVVLRHWSEKESRGVVIHHNRQTTERSCQFYGEYINWFVEISFIKCISFIVESPLRVAFGSFKWRMFAHRPPKSPKWMFFPETVGAKVLLRFDV